MNGWIILTLLLAIAAALLLVGCTSNRPYRTGFNPGNSALPGPDPTNAVIEATPDYTLGFVEFDDQGWFWDVKQKEAVEQMIRDQAGIGHSNNPAGIIMVFFAHGWKNNAAFDNDNVNTFRATLKQLSSVEQTLSQQANRPPRKLLGIYAGWRGLSIKSDYFPLPLGKELSFWGRKNAAQKVGGYGAMTELLMDLESLQKAGNDSLATNAPRTRLLIIGHSFGADAVYNALSQVVTERFVDTIKQGKGEVLKPLGDQVILLNPAFEAARLYDLKQLALSVRQYSTNQRPVLSIFTSKGDWATHIFFPMGQTLGTIFQSHRSTLQKEANRQAVGWFEPFITHELIYSENPSLPAPTNKPTLRTSDKLPGAAANIVAQRRIWRSASSATETNVFGNCVLKPKGDYRAHNPILVVSVDKKIMKDHDDIANPVLINFLQEYIPFCDDESSAGAPGAK